jgi:hypothetical protein
MNTNFSYPLFALVNNLLNNIQVNLRIFYKLFSFGLKLQMI